MQSFVPRHQGYVYCAEVLLFCTLQVKDFSCSHRCTASTAQAPQALHRQQKCLRNMLTVYCSAKSVQAILPISSMFTSSSHPCSVIMNALPCCVLISPALPRMLNTTSLASACKTTRRVCLAATDVHYVECMPPLMYCLCYGLPTCKLRCEAAAGSSDCLFAEASSNRRFRASSCLCLSLRC